MTQRNRAGRKPKLQEQEIEAKLEELYENRDKLKADRLFINFDTGKVNWEEPTEEELAIRKEIRRLIAMRNRRNTKHVKDRDKESLNQQKNINLSFMYEIYKRKKEELEKEIEETRRRQDSLTEREKAARGKKRMPPMEKDLAARSRYIESREKEVAEMLRIAEAIMENVATEEEKMRDREKKIIDKERNAEIIIGQAKEKMRLIEIKEKNIIEREKKLPINKSSTKARDINKQ